ncbi:hypothetical protein [Microseira wollei]|nr:hypothetical protein [Microseira wollei]
MITAREMYAQIGFQQDIELPQRLGIRYWRYFMQLDVAVESAISCILLWFEFENTH